MGRNDKHLTADRLIACYFADDRDVAAATDRSHTAICTVCALRYADLARELDLLADQASIETDAAFPPHMLVQQRAQIMRRLELHGRRADIFVFPARRVGAVATRTVLRRPARWVAGAAAAGLAVGLGLGFGVERYHFHELTGSFASRGDLRGAEAPRWQADARLQQAQPEPIFSQAANQVVPGDDELLEEIDTALVTGRVQELRALDALTPETLNLRVRRR